MLLTQRLLKSTFITFFAIGVKICPGISVLTVYKTTSTKIKQSFLLQVSATKAGTECLRRVSKSVMNI